MKWNVKKIKKGHPALTIPLTIPLTVCVSTEVKIHVEVPKYPFNDWFGFFLGGGGGNKQIYKSYIKLNPCKKGLIVAHSKKIPY